MLVALLTFPFAAARTPKPVSSAFFVTEAGAFTLYYPTTEVSYNLTLAVSQSLPLPAFLQVEYENPANENDPDLQYLVVAVGQQKVELESRVFPHAKHRKTYRVVIEVFSDKSMRNKIGEHIQPIEFVALPR